MRKRRLVANMTPEQLKAYRKRGREQSAKWRALNPKRNKEIMAKATAKRAEAKKAYDAARYLEVRETRIAQSVAWRRADKRRDFAYKVNQKAKKYGLGGRLDWRDLVAGPCSYCGAPCESWDHVIPMSKGGPNTLDNLVPACWPCNQRKKDKMPVGEWALKPNVVLSGDHPLVGGDEH